MYNYLYNDRSFLNQRNEQTIVDFGQQPFVIDINKAVLNNNNFRTTLWTGKHLQLTLMSIPVGEDIGLEIHPNIDQFICIQDGVGRVMIGNDKNNLYYQQMVYDDSAIFVPANTWHNIVNVGETPLKLFAIYAPINHKPGTIHKTKQDASLEE
jgi:mannose-6-phosphate isomerase-like protein (cupin superfamily)